MRGPDWYAEWRHDAVRELIAKQDRLKAQYALGEWPRYDYDARVGALTFSDEKGPKVVADIQIVGTIGPKDWLWSWANPHWADCCIGRMQEVRDFGVEHGIGELTSDCVEDEDPNGLGWQLTAVAARVLDTVGAYRAPSGDGAVFFVCSSIRLVS
jgi:hypothetical protein